MQRTVANCAPAVVLAIALAAAGCSSLTPDALSSAPPAGAIGHVQGFLGGVVADEPRAALLARDVLSAGGNAADAAVALGFALSVTYPSRAGLGAGGACLVYMADPRAPGGGGVDAVLFTSVPPANAAGADRPAAVPMLARGLFALHARYGRQPFETLIAPAEQLARFGAPASRAFVRDLGVVAGPLQADPGAAAAFYRDGRPVAEGVPVLQPELAATLAQLRQAGVGDLYQGLLAHRLEDTARQAGAGLTLADLRGALPHVVASLSLPAGDDTAAFLPLPADGGVAAAAAFQVLQGDRGAVDAAGTRALAVAARLRQNGADAQSVLAAKDLPPGSLPALPASTSFATLDQGGDAVVCAVSMNNLFGTGRMAPGTGVLLAASPAWLPPPLLAAALVYNANEHAFRAAVGGSGQAGAPLAAAVALTQALADQASPPVPMSRPVPDPGRANVIECNRYLPREDGSCGWATDPRGAGLAIGSSN
jgi:gamma-glutamyltranspeptidase/glutathione hydrolase